MAAPTGNRKQVSTASASNVKRQHLSISLRGLLIVVTLASLLLGVLTWRYRESRRLRQALADMGGYVVVKEPCGTSRVEGSISSLVTDLVCMPTVEEVTFHGDWLPAPQPRLAIWSYSHPMCDNIDDRKLKILVSVLSPLPKCPKLSLIGTSVTDDGLAELQTLHSLEQLDLTGSQISGAGLRKLNTLRLQSLNLSYTRLSDNDVPRIVAFRDLRTLDVSMSQISEAGASRLRKSLPECTAIWSVSE
jgi:Leucine Rich repeat